MEKEFGDTGTVGKQKERLDKSGRGHDEHVKLPERRCQIGLGQVLEPETPFAHGRHELIV